MLFLDELPELQPQALDALRQPLKTGEVAIARANHRATYPARCMLLDSTGLGLLRDAADAMRLSARGYYRVLRVARTLADLGAEKVSRVHLAEALSYRALTDKMRRAA